MKFMNYKKITQKERSEALGTTPRTIRNWSDKGCPRNSDSTYSLPAVFEWVIAEREETASPENRNFRNNPMQALINGTMRS